MIFFIDLSYIYSNNKIQKMNRCYQIDIQLKKNHL